MIISPPLSLSLNHFFFLSALLYLIPPPPSPLLVSVVYIIVFVCQNHLLSIKIHVTWMFIYN